MRRREADNKGRPLSKRVQQYLVATTRDLLSMIQFSDPIFTILMDEKHCALHAHFPEGLSYDHCIHIEIWQDALCGAREQ